MQKELGLPRGSAPARWAPSKARTSRVPLPRTPSPLFLGQHVPVPAPQHQALSQGTAGNRLCPGGLAVQLEKTKQEPELYNCTAQPRRLAPSWLPAPSQFPPSRCCSCLFWRGKG